MSLQDFVYGCTYALTQAYPIPGVKKLTKADFDSADTTQLQSEASSFYSSFKTRIANAPGIPGLNLNGVPVPIDQQAGYDYCRLRIGRIAAFPSGAWDWAGDTTLADDMTAVAAAQPRVLVTVVNGVIVLTES